MVNLKIGLLTTYSFNYGSYHQAVSLQRKLQDMGHECELINEKTKMFEWANLFCLYTANVFLPMSIKKQIAKKLPQYNSFLMIQNDTKDLAVSPANMLSFSKLSKRYDCIVVGSDELWSASRESIRFCPEYLGLKWKCPLISYGTCAIKLNPENEKLRKKVKAGLTRFKAISVRDTCSKKKVQAIIKDMPVEIVLDPTLLYPFFIKADVTTDLENRYVLLYGQHYDEKQKKYITEFARKEKAEIYSIGWSVDWSDEFINVSSALELQNVFAKALFCFPSTFHGTIFSILNHKQFIAMLNPLRGHKVKLLLQQLGLENRLFSENIAMEAKINYEAVERTIEEWRKKSEDYLIKALERMEM